VDKTDIIYINFEDERIDIKGENLQTLIDAYWELYTYKDIKQVYFFFDEIQNIEHWDKFVRRIYEQ
jgi:predicted AAA+ superfamily ATPase